mgnify:CR=1 FL=1
MAYNGVVFGGPIGAINVGLFAAVGLLGPLLLQIDLMLFGSLGIGALHANFSAQLSASLQASLDIGLSIANPFVGFSIALSAIAVLSAQITLALSGALPTFSINVSLQLSANASLVASLTAQLGGLELLIQAALLLKIPALEFLARLDLSAGPFLVASWENMPLRDGAGQFQLDASNGMNYGPMTIGATESTYGVVVFTKSPTAWIGLKAVLMA